MFTSYLENAFRNAFNISEHFAGRYLLMFVGCTLLCFILIFYA